MSSSAASGPGAPTFGGPVVVAARRRDRARGVLPGFGLSAGITLTYLSLIVLIPLSTLVLKSFSLTWAQFTHIVTDPRTLAAYRGKPVSFHCEDPELLERHRGAATHEARRPPECELSATRFALAMVRKHDLRGKLCHYSVGEGLPLIRAARAAGLPVTAEVTPHHVFFDTAMLTESNRPWMQMNPPLRGPADREAMLAALRDGTADYLATDHAPHRADEKEVGFEAAPRGVIGLETAAAATWMALSDRDRLFSALSTEPARLLGLADHGRPVEAGVMANLVVFDPQAPWVVDSFSSKSANSPYLGQGMTGRVRATVFEGMVVHSREKEPV